MQISAVFHYQEIVFDREKKIKDSFITCFASQESLNKQWMSEHLSLLLHFVWMTMAAQHLMHIVTH